MLHRRIRNLAITAITIVSATILTALSVTTASAATYGPPSACWEGEGGCFLYNLVKGTNVPNNLYINGFVHEQILYASSYSAIGYTFVPKDDNIWGWMQDNVDPSLCWNYSGTDQIALDSCQNGDHNEYFDFVESSQAPKYWNIHNYARGNDWNVAADKDGDELYFTTYDNHTSQWNSAPNAP